jgi:hypothetical protein
MKRGTEVTGKGRSRGPGEPLEEAGKGGPSRRSKKPDEMEGFRPGPGNTGSMDGKDETGRRQVNHKV